MGGGERRVRRASTGDLQSFTLLRQAQLQFKIKFKRLNAGWIKDYHKQSYERRIITVRTFGMAKVTGQKCSGLGNASKVTAVPVELKRDPSTSSLRALTLFTNAFDAFVYTRSLLKHTSHDTHIYKLDRIIIVVVY
jgi:hypothetical protein